MNDGPRVCQDCRYWHVVHHPIDPHNALSREWNEGGCQYKLWPDRDGGCLFVWPVQREMEVRR